MDESVFERLQYLILSALMLTVVYFRSVEEGLDGMYRDVGGVGGGGLLIIFNILGLLHTNICTYFP